MSSTLGESGEYGNENVEGRCAAAQAPQDSPRYCSGGEQQNVAPAPVQRHQPGTWECMVQARRWLLWREVPVPGKKPRKVPYYIDGAPREGMLDTPADWAKLSTYQEACNRVA